ncbi:MAG: DUF370 domain-containing protein [Chloroflexota bacterium]
MLHVGNNAFLIKHRILAIVPWASSPIKSLKKKAKEEGLLLDVTFGKPTRSLIVMDNGLTVLCSIQPETLQKRWSKGDS